MKASKGPNEGKAKVPGMIKVDQDEVKNHLSEMVKTTVEETLNALLDAEADQLAGAGKYERTEARKDYRAGHYQRKLHTKAGEVNLKMPKLRKVPFETAIIERYQRRESSVEEALVEMYLAGISVRRVEDITEALWGTRVSPSTISNLNQKIYDQIDTWRNRPLEMAYPYVYLDGVWLKRSWGGEVRNISVLVAVGVNEDGYREILGVEEGIKEDGPSWKKFLTRMKERGLRGTKLFISDKCLGLVEALGNVYPYSRWQRCCVHFYRNVFSSVPRGKLREVAAMLKAIHAQEDQEEAVAKIKTVTEKLRRMKLENAANLLEEFGHETLSYFSFPSHHWRHIRTNNPLERLMREIRRRTRVVGSFPDGKSALMLVSARLRHVAGSRWGTRRYMDMGHLKEMEVLAEAG